MRIGYSIAGVCIALALSCSAGDLLAQAYPAKSVRILASDPGGTVDLLARLMGPGLANALGQSFVTENRPTILAIETASKAPPDGYTLLTAAGTLWIGPLLQKLPYDPVKDFAPISLLTSSANLLVTHPSLPVKSAADLIRLAKSQPGALNYSTGPIGSYPFLAANLFRSLAGLKMVGIVYKGSAPALTAVITGEVQLTFGTPGSLATHVKSNRLKAIAVTSLEPSVLAPGVPPLAASGIPGYEAVASQGFFAPAGTQAAIVSRLNQEVVRYLRQPEVKEKLLASGLEPVGSSAEQLGAAIKSEITKWGKLIAEAGIRVE